MTDDQPANPKQDDEASFPVSRRAGSLLRRLQPDAPTDPPPTGQPEHVSPFTVENIDSAELEEAVKAALAGEGAEEDAAADPQEALHQLEEKMAGVMRELAEGRINMAQFQAIYTHYSEKRAVIERLISRHPQSDAWERAAADGHTGFLRRRHAAHLAGLALFDNWRGTCIYSLGVFDLPHEVLASLLGSLSEPPPEPTSSPHCTQIEGGRWLAVVRGTFTMAVAVFSAEPAAVQLVQQGHLHREFERINQRALEAGQTDRSYLRFPQAGLFE